MRRNIWKNDGHSSRSKKIIQEGVDDANVPAEMSEVLVD